MRLQKFIALISSLILVAMSFGDYAKAHTVTFYVHNKCPFPIWPATAPNNGFPILADGGFALPSGHTRRLIAPWKWTGRVWARTNCNFGSGNSSSANWPRACETGDCDGRLQCNGLIGAPPATLVQISVQADPTKLTFYDVSLVDGHNIPVSVSARPAASKCAIGGCARNLNAACPEELRVLGGDGGAEVVACKSACLAFDVDAFCCRNAYGSPEKCPPSVYSKVFKEACPSYYSYAFDSPPPLASCAAKEYVITFCPSAWGGGNSTAAMFDVSR